MSTTETATQGARGIRALAGKYLTFALGEEEYGVPVLRVREIIKMTDITAVPQVPPCVKGVINLRGKVIAVVDLRLKFGFPEQAYSDRTSIVVVEVMLEKGRVPMGVVVDSVSDVLNIATDELEETLAFGSEVRTDYLKGVAKVKGKVKLLLDLDRVFAAEVSMAGFEQHVA